jgi:hypothetical protein
MLVLGHTFDRGASARPAKRAEQASQEVSAASEFTS